MPARDWLVGDDRASVATERIYAAAADMIARRGFERFTIDALARKVHCSPATVYRHAGGKTAIREAVVLRMSARVVGAVREAIEGRTGSERMVVAVEVALERMRAEPLAQLMRAAVRSPDGDEWVTASPVITGLAGEMAGATTTDPAAAQWLIHVVLALWCWPVAPAELEHEMLERFFGPGFDAPG
ncbi:TetR/AcrR family transcriptional regulator [Mycolicibacterium palauense]|uniref:TetR/AcrR family transcriptional regulator n=1 Tax=Mycolicibacterium palauense TaxID=2034511 RepID=UPI000BFEC667|nr:TetR/AcrR family transcriptional regulator [Mycolicibacterium palauense]